MDSKTRRLNKEIKDIANDKVSGITIELVNESITHMYGRFFGPADTPYEGGHFTVEILVPDTYPFKPLQMKFITRVYHPNISSASGAICLDILKDTWAPVLTLKSTLISLQSLLCSPEPNNPQDAEVAKHYMSDRPGFEQTAREWTRLYAFPSASAPTTPTRSKNIDFARAAGLDEAHILKFTSLGFERPRVIEILRRMDYRGSKADEIHDDRVVQELLK